MDLQRWLLTKRQRANPHSRIDDTHPGQDAWSLGNEVRPLVHGVTYFAELLAAIDGAAPGDLVLFTDWRGDPDERLDGTPGSEVREVLGRADERGVDVRGLVWRSHTDLLQLSAEENRHLADELQASGAEVLLDMRVRSGGAHHQKLVVVRHRDDPARDVAFVGGIDLCHSRRDDIEHAGDPQPLAMARAYGPRPPWHDLMAAIRGPGVHDVETTFRERWEDPAPLSRNPIQRVRDRVQGLDSTPDPLPKQAPPPPPVSGGTHAVQILRTYPNLRRRRDHPFAVGGERSVARGYAKAMGQVEHLVYIEDQYLWSHSVADQFSRVLRERPDLRVVAVLPHVPDQDGIGGRMQLVGRWRAMTQMAEAAQGRFAAYGIENRWGTPIYVHAKTCIMDDCWATIGSDNFNRRSWTHDSEISCVVVDTAEEDHSAYARRLRLSLAAEHLERPVGLDSPDLLEVMGDCLDGPGMFAAFAEAAAALQAWHDGGRVGPRPPGRLRPLAPPDQSRAERWALTPLYHLLADPDGRPGRLKRRRAY